MASPAPNKKGTNQFMRQGHTAENLYGADPDTNFSPISAKLKSEPRELKP